jgi:uncharacterized protein
MSSRGLDEGRRRYQRLCQRRTQRLALHVVGQRGTLLKSAATERQLFEVLARPQLAALIDRASIDHINKLMAAAEPVTITDRIVARRDATDDKFLELAVNGKADVIVSGDADLLVLNPFRDIPIVMPATFARHGKDTAKPLSVALWRTTIIKRLPRPCSSWRASSCEQTARWISLC